MAAKDWIQAYKLGYQDHLLSFQILLVALGALVTVPVLTGLDPAVALFTAGVATLIFHFCTRRQIPVFLASSFAYTAPVMAWATLFAIVLSFLGKLRAVFQSIPDPVSGGILILFFGALVVTGIRCLQKVQSDLMEFRNILVVLLILVTGIGGITLSAGALTLKGVALATLTGIILNLVLPDKMRADDS